MRKNDRLFHELSFSFSDKEFTSAMENIFLVSLAVAKVLRHAKLMPAAIKKDFDFAREAMSLLGITYSRLEVARKTAWFKYVHYDTSFIVQNDLIVLRCSKGI